MFPFLHSTEVFPEWPFAALTRVSKDVSREVQSALLNIYDHSMTGHQLEHCMIDPWIANETSCRGEVMTSATTRCDTTEELATFAFEAVKSAELAGFRPSRSYSGVRTMQQEIDFAEKNERGQWQCERDGNLYNGIDCPEGHYRMNREEFDRACELKGLVCKDGFECFCSPCIKAFEVSVYEVDNGISEEHLSMVGQGCSKMSLCGDVEQTRMAVFRAIDNRERPDAVVTAQVHLGQLTQQLEVKKVPGEDYIYEFAFSKNEMGVAVMEIFFDGEQIPESPLRVEILSRNCDIDYPGQRMDPDEDGICLCRDGTVKIGSKCARYVEKIV